MKLPLRIAIVATGLLVAGAIRVSLESSLTRDLRQARLLSEPLKISVGERIDQTSSAVALGGLRTLVATFLNLRAYGAFEDDRWVDLEKDFETIVALVPNSEYYWQTGSWHLYANAVNYYQNDESIPALLRLEKSRAYIRKGRAFLERGIRNNPGSWPLLSDRGRLLADPYRMSAFGDRSASFAESALSYQAATDTGKAPAYMPRMAFFSLARVPGKEMEALALAEKLYRQSRSNQVPRLISLLYVLRMHANPSQDPAALISALFKDDETAYRDLSVIWNDKNDQYPIDGVASALQLLEKRLSIPWDQSVLNPGAKPRTSPNKPIPEQ